jgi:hypothetical protein
MKVPEDKDETSTLDFILYGFAGLIFVVFEYAVIRARG